MSFMSALVKSRRTLERLKLGWKADLATLLTVECRINCCNVVVFAIRVGGRGASGSKRAVLGSSGDTPFPLPNGSLDHSYRPWLPRAAARDLKFVWHIRVKVRANLALRGRCRPICRAYCFRAVATVGLFTPTPAVAVLARSILTSTMGSLAVGPLTTRLQHFTASASCKPPA